MIGVADLWNRVVRKVQCKIVLFRYGPRFDIVPYPGLRQLGTPYGGWVFADTPQLRGCHVISCGLGEDASFDVEFAGTYDAHIIIVDPTPRAITHFNEIKARIGAQSECDYSGGGKQPAEAYDLSKVRSDQLVLIDKAVTDSTGCVRFYAPPNPEHVSHSVINYQNNYSDSTPFIEVESTTFRDLLALVDVGKLQIVKLDIEGAELKVIPQMLQSGIRPPQILVEFDELSSPSKRARSGFEMCDGLLRKAGYVVAHCDDQVNFLYLHESLYSTALAAASS